MLSSLKIRLYGDPVLRKKSSPVQEVGPSERILIQSMIATMHHYKGIGLAAPQVGINQEIIVVDIGDGPMTMINPAILEKEGKIFLEEGCLSIPEVTVNVKRSKEIKVQYLNVNGKNIKKTFKDLFARVILHEVDHLKGKLIIDYASKEEKEKFKDKLEEIEKESSKL